MAKSNDNKYTYLTKNTLALFLSSFSSKFLSFFLLPLYTGILSTAEYGLADLSYTTVSMAYTVLTLMIADAIMRFGITNEYSHKDLLSSGMVFHFGTCACVICLGICASIVLAGTEYIRVLPYTVVYYFFFSIESILCAFAKGLNRITIIAISGVISTITATTSMLVSLLVLKIGFDGYMISLIIGQASATLYIAIGIKAHRYVQMKLPSKDMLRTLLAYSTPVMLTQIGWWTNSYGSRYVVLFSLDNSAVGVLTAAMKLPTVLTTMSSVFIQAWKLSAVTEYEKDKNSKFFSEIFNVYNTAIMIICCILMTLTLPISSILLKNDFITGWNLIPFLLLGAMFNGTSAFAGAIFNAGKNTKSLIYSTVTGAIINIALCILLVPRIGILGAAISSCICYFVIARIRNYQVKQIIGHKFGSGRKTNVSYVIMLISAILTSLDSPWFRYIGGFICFVGIIALNWTHIISTYMRISAFIHVRSFKGGKK